jgi:2-polyprenyl-6-methoxyphenol hydroxylase-like FAD-dependent oxidoreductase
MASNMLVSMLVNQYLSLCLLEKRDSPSSVWRAPGIHARTMEMLARHDLSDTFLESGYIVDGPGILYEGQITTINGFKGVRTEFPMVLTCAQTITERILRDKLDKLHVPIYWSHEFIDYEFVDSHISARFKQVDAAGQEQLMTREFAYLVGCDGGHSRVRKVIGAEFHGETRNLIITVCDATMNADWLPHLW